MLAFYSGDSYRLATMSVPESAPTYEQPAAVFVEDMGLGYADDPEEHFTIDVLQRYLQEIGKAPLLDAEQEVDLAKRIEAGLFAGHLVAAATEAQPFDAQRYKDLVTLKQEGEVALRGLFEANLRLVVSVAKRYQRRGLDLLDLIQEGNFGLMRAVEKFDYKKGFKFSTYATWWIRKAINQGLADGGSNIRLPIKVAETLTKLNGVQRTLRSELSREPTSRELAAEMGCTLKKLEEYLDLSRTMVSLDQPAITERDKTVGMTLEQHVIAEVPRTEDIAFDNVHIHQLSHALNSLTDIKGASGKMLRDILCMHWGLFGYQDMTLEEIGSKYGRSRESIRLLERKGFQQLLEILASTGADINSQASLPKPAKATK